MYEISVVIPTYNRGKLITDAIGSVLDQEGQEELYRIREIIVADDCSTDDTEEVIRSLCDDRIVYHRMDHNSGAAAARNAGVEIASGEWIAFQDSDDKWHPDKLCKQSGYLDIHPEVNMVSHTARVLFDDGHEIITQSLAETNVVPYLAVRNYYDTPTMLLKRDLFLGLDGFNTELKALEDWEFALRFADKYGVGMVPEPLIDSIMISDGVSSRAADYYESRCRMIAMDKDILIKHGCLDDAIRSLLVHAKNNDVLDMVGRILELYLST